MNCSNKKLNDVCIICKWSHYFTIIVYEEVIDNKNIIEKFLDFDMEIIIPLVRRSFLKWYKKFNDQLLDNKEYIEAVNDNPIVSFAKKLILVKEETDHDGVIQFIHRHSGLVASEYVKSPFFKELINMLKFEKK